MPVANTIQVADPDATGPVPARQPASTLSQEDALTRRHPDRKPPAAARSLAPLPKGTVLGRYVVLAPLGRGGFGAVYTAYDPKLDRRVAIKLLLDRDEFDRTDAEAGARLLREAQAMASLSHPNVVNVHDVGTADGRVFMAMERVDGVTLDVWLTQVPRSWREVLTVMLGAARGLAAAHASGIVHRDFKPPNVLIDSDGRARVLDFGLARRIDAPPQGHRSAVECHQPSESLLDQHITADGLLLGTPAYMAPEQFLEHDADAFSDQFAFCVTLYSALVGERPFDTATSPATLAEQVRRGLGDGRRSSMPIWLWETIARGLRYEPSERFESMDALIATLTRELRTRRLGWAAVAVAVALSSTATGALMRSFSDENQVEAPDAVTTIVHQARVAAAKSFFVYPPSEDPDYPTAYVRVRELETMDTTAARANASELRGEFANTLVRLGDEFWEREGGRTFSADYYAAALVFDPNNEHARSRTTMTDAQLAGLEHKAANQAFDPAELRAADVLAALALPDDAARRARVSKLRTQRDSRPALTVLAELERILGEPTPPVSPPAQESPSPDANANSASVSDTPKQSMNTQRGGRGAAQRSTRAGRAAFKQGDWDEAERCYHAALEHQRNNLDALLGLSELYFERGAYHRSVAFARRAVRAAPKRGGPRIALGDALLKTVKYAEARKQYESAKALGDRRAKGRLDRLDRQVGQ